ncbi:hypothetical protein BVY04_00220 [bacterium M21]|nr:hypothetical protein BVY04_00220 [bacterium M21]
MNKKTVVISVIVILGFVGLYFVGTSIREGAIQKEQTAGQAEGDSGSTVKVGPAVVDLKHLNSTDKRPVNPDAERLMRNDRIAATEGYGKTPGLTEEEKKHPQVRSAIEALNTGKHPERVSAMFPATRFDRNRFVNDKEYRENYLKVAEPGRVFQEDQQAKTQIQRISPYFQEVVQGKSILLEVKGAPGMPVSATSFDLGKLGNGLTYETKVFDSKGYAGFKFMGMPGTVNGSNILVSSPACRGRLKFIAHTLLPQVADETLSKNQK